MAGIPLVYSVRNLLVRRTSTVLTALGIGAVAWVFIFTLALAGGFEAALRTTGSPKNAIVVRSGAASELMSIVSREGASSVTAQPEIARAADGSPLRLRETPRCQSTSVLPHRGPQAVGMEPGDVVLGLLA